MTLTEQWILGLLAVYSMPAYLLGVGTTLLFVRLRGRGSATMPSFLSPELTFERHDLETPGATPADESHGLLAQHLRLR
jgi:hypothetical protein